MDRSDDERATAKPLDRPFKALDDDEAPGSDADADAGPITTAAPVMAGMTGGPPGVLGSTGAPAETARIPETNEAQPKP
jgi:hypothetical protein